MLLRTTKKHAKPRLCRFGDIYIWQVQLPAGVLTFCDQSFSPGIPHHNKQESPPQHAKPSWRKQNGPCVDSNRSRTPPTRTHDARAHTKKTTFTTARTADRTCLQFLINLIKINDTHIRVKRGTPCLRQTFVCGMYPLFILKVASTLIIIITTSNPFYETFCLLEATSRGIK